MPSDAGWFGVRLIGLRALGALRSVALPGFVHSELPEARRFRGQTGTHYRVWQAAWGGWAASDASPVAAAAVSVGDTLPPQNQIGPPLGPISSEVYVPIGVRRLHVSSEVRPAVAVPSAWAGWPEVPPSRRLGLSGDAFGAPRLLL